MAKTPLNDFQEHLYIAILCGGGGKRLWPRSREKTPKQFIDLFGNGTIFQQTVKRAKKIVGPEKIFIVTAYNYVDNVLSQDRDILLRNIIAEPMAKNTAQAMVMAAVCIFLKDPEAVIINLASDQTISPDDVFVKDMLLAAETAVKTGMIVTVGIKPTFPHTGFGYIKAGQKKTSVRGKDVYEVSKFIEKPDLKTARKFIEAGHYFWNANLYTWQAGVLFETLDRFAPKLAALAQKAKRGIGQPGEAALIREIYQEAEDISIDYAVSERANNLILIPASFSWDDIGDWEVVYQRSRKDKDGNVVIKYGKGGDFVVVEAENNLIHFNDQLLALVGVKDLIVVDTDDALLIGHRSKAQKVKQIVKKLEEQGKKNYL